MSFIYEDKNLIKELIALAQASKFLSPTAPPPAGTTPPAPDKSTAPVETSKDPRVLEIAKKLIQNLQTEFNGGFTADRDNADLRTTHLQNLSELLHFLSFNGIRYGGMPLVVDYTGKGVSTEPGKAVYDTKKPSAIIYDSYDANKKAQYVPYPNSNDLQYYVHKNGLIAYLRDLQSKNNPILNAMTNKLINQVNSELQIQMPKEPPVEVAGPEDPAKQTPQPKPGTTPAGTAPTSTNASEIELLNQAIEELPFDTQDIDFNRINIFFETYKKLISGPNILANRKTQVLNFIQQAEEAMKNAMSITNPPRDNFQMYNLTPNMVQTWLKTPQGQYYGPLLNQLMAVINGTQYVVNDLYASYFRRLSPDQQNLVQQQIVGNSKYRSNFNTIRQMLSRLGEVKQGK